MHSNIYTFFSPNKSSLLVCAYVCWRTKCKIVVCKLGKFHCANPILEWNSWICKYRVVVSMFSYIYTGVAVNGLAALHCIPLYKIHTVMLIGNIFVRIIKEKH